MQTTPQQSSRYCEGFDDNGQWLLSMAYAAIEEQGSIVQLGQIGPFVQRRLDALVRDGALVKYRGHWDTLLTFCGMGPLKTIWATPEIAEAAGADMAKAA